MANPEVTVTEPGGLVVPGSSIEFTWVAVDPDTRTVSGSWSGHDDQGNVVSGTVSLSLQDNFTMDTFTLGGAILAIDNLNRRATGVAPVA